MFVSALGAVIERDVLRGLIELQAAGGREALDESWLPRELMRKLMSFKHGLRVGAGGRGEARVEYERGCTGPLARLVGKLEQVLFDLKLVFHVWDIGSVSGSGLQRGTMTGLPGAIGRGKVNRGLQGHHPCAEHECEQLSGGLKHPVRAYWILGGIVPQALSA